MKHRKLLGMLALGCLVLVGSCKKGDVSNNKTNEDNSFINRLLGTPGNDDHSDGSIVVVLNRGNGNDGLDVRAAFFNGSDSAKGFGTVSIGSTGLTIDNNSNYTLQTNGASPMNYASWFGANTAIAVSGAGGIAGFNITRDFPQPLELTNAQPDGTSTIVNKSLGITVNWTGVNSGSNQTYVILNYEAMPSKYINANAPATAPIVYFSAGGGNSFTITPAMLSGLPSNAYFTIRVVRGFGEVFNNSNGKVYDVLVYSESDQMYTLQN
jgi:hypothetical protein